jgi:hypothetical protein
MSLMKKLGQLEKKFAWSLMGTLVGIAGIVFAAVTFFYEKKPSLTYEIVSNTSVVDVRESVDMLVVLYDGKDIQKNHETLRILVIKVVNDGSGAVLKSYYDGNDPLGLTLTNGRVIQSDVIDASSDYLRKQIKPERRSPTMITFSDVILEPKDFFVIKVLILTSDEVQDLGLRPIGTLANVRAKEVVLTYKERETAPFLTRAFGGGMLVQVTRFFSYFLGSIILLFGLILSAITVSDLQQKAKRKRLVKEFRDVSFLKFKKADEALLDLFIKDGVHSLVEVRRLIINPASLRDASKFGRELIRAGVLRKTRRNVGVDAGAKRTLESFLKYYKKRTGSKAPR